ncbi:MAG TPA: hypothetical protein VM681_05350 [Candidatus Thermoplasmatota archaeon]|nr:hypothetical protein [Candidatus Thermoplasmatota archaeon]
MPVPAERYLCVFRIPRSFTVETFRESMVSVATEAHRRGARALETFYSIDGGRAYTLFEADGPGTVQEVCAAAGFSAEVVPGDRLHTELLDEPRRTR